MTATTSQNQTLELSISAGGDYDVSKVHNSTEGCNSRNYRAACTMPVHAAGLAQNNTTGTLAIACDHVFWPGMIQDIISHVQKCATYQKIQNWPPQESLSEKSVPSRP
ncbi:hypothetical protein PR048_013261 [Dryococelus australis]|uniref:Integrase zinc-binding domain-containing protein n=1 Tax=Dryococelus australis TaxID=614101 RepID=A0ABQ9HSI2_9NEOP|nr:hypothetical protein PR048_013261 [Dryococelus australis]